MTSYKFTQPTLKLESFSHPMASQRHHMRLVGIVNFDPIQKIDLLVGVGVLWNERLTLVI